MSRDLRSPSDATIASCAVQVEMLKADLQQQAALLQSERDNTIQEVSTHMTFHNSSFIPRAAAMRARS